MRYKYSLTIFHADHIPERKASLHRLLVGLAGKDEADRYAQGQLSDAWERGDYRIKVRVIAGRKTCEERWKEAWAFHANSGADYGITLDDDVIPCHDFWATLDKAIEACPNHLVCLSNAICADYAKVADQHGLHWVTSNDALIGYAYVAPKALYEELLGWTDRIDRDVGLHEHEDTLLNVFAMWRKLLVWHTVPALFDHDTSVASTWHNPHAAEQLKAIVPPRDGMADLEWKTDAVHAGRRFRGNHWHLLMSVKGDHDFRARLERHYELERAAQ